MKHYRITIWKNYDATKRYIQSVDHGRNISGPVLQISDGEIYYEQYGAYVLSVNKNKITSGRIGYIGLELGEAWRCKIWEKSQDEWNELIKTAYNEAYNKNRDDLE